MLPGLILLAVWLASWLAQKSRVVHLVDVPDFLKRAPRAFVIFCCAGAIFVPPAIGNLGGLAFKRTFVGEIAAVDKICQGIPKGSSVLIIDYNMMEGSARPSAACATCRWRPCTPRSRKRHSR